LFDNVLQPNAMKFRGLSLKAARGDLRDQFSKFYETGLV